MTLRTADPLAPSAADCPAGIGRAGSGRLALLALALAACGGAAFAIDIPMARFCKERQNPLPGDLARIIDLAEVFGYGASVAVLLAGVVALDPTVRLPRLGRPLGIAERGFVRLVAATYAGGLVVDVIKVLVDRVRPRAADLTAMSSAFDTFGAVATAGHRGSNSMSFPSGHSAVAAGLAAALAARYPRATPYFVGIATCTACQRVFSSAHYPSDIAFGAAIGLLGAAACLRSERSAMAESPPPC